MRVSIWPCILCVKKTMTQYVVFFGCSVTALRYEMWDGTNHSHQLAIAKSLLGDGFR